MAYHQIEEIFHDLQQGKLIIAVDEQTEEGSLIGLADHITPEMIKFMINHGKGHIFIALSPTLAAKLPSWTENKQQESSKQKNSEIDVHQQAELIKEWVTNPQQPLPTSLFFPLVSKEGGILERLGYTEAAVDLARLVGKAPVAVICQILNSDKTLARLPQLEKLAKRHHVKILFLQQLQAYQKQLEANHRKANSEYQKWIDEMIQIKLPTAYGDFQMAGFLNHFDEQEHVALIIGNPAEEETPHVRIHSECLTGDVFGSKRCECGEQLHRAIDELKKVGSGVILYMRQEGRGIGLYQKLKAYKLQEQGYDTVEANHQLGFPDDLRNYLIAAEMLRALGIHRIILLSNNPEKRRQLEEYGIEVVSMKPLEIPASPENKQYLITKKEKMGHLLDL